MFDYNISSTADNLIFLKTCKDIEDNFNLEHKPPVVDVDGSAVQVYQVNGKEIRVDIDILIDAVFVVSDIDLSHIIS